MIRLNRTTEYGLMALRHMSRKSTLQPLEVTSAREIADTYGLPFEITAKTLQRLRDTGLIQSAQGARGGYLLLRALSEVSLAEFLGMMEGPQSMVVCATPSPDPEEHPTSGCEYGKKCEIKQVMHRLNHRFVQFLSEIRLADLTEDLLKDPTTTDPQLSIDNSSQASLKDSFKPPFQGSLQRAFPELSLNTPFLHSELASDAPADLVTPFNKKPNGFEDHNS